MSAAYLWVKALHIVFVAAWFAALFYLPRFLVNLATVAPASHAERERLLAMARRLARFGMLLMWPALGLGLALWLGFGVSGGWLHAKLALVLLIVGYQHLCAAHLRRFERGAATRSERWYRVFNEVSVLGFAAIVILAVVKPF